MDELYTNTPEDIMLDKEAEDIEDASNDIVNDRGSDIDMIANISDEDIDEIDDDQDDDEYEDDPDDDNYIDYEVSEDDDTDDEDEINIKIIDDIECNGNNKEDY